MHAMRDKLQTEIHSNSQELEDKTAELEATIKEKEEEIAKMQQEYEQMKAELEEDISNKDHRIEELGGETESLRSALKQTSDKAEKLSELAEKAGMVEGLQHKIKKLEAEKQDLIQKGAADTQAMEARHAKAVSDLKATIADQEQKLADADETRRKMHNIIQELRGNIRVYIRVRPFLTSAVAAGNGRAALPV
jgi:kinesin family protein C1